jgi:uncharacterized protein YllA (UPF0747 family)
MGTLSVRARVEPRHEPRFERLFDPLLDELTRGGPLARSRFPTLWRDGDGLKRLAGAKRGPLPAELAREMADFHRRLGASPRSLAALDRLARGEAVCAVAGQQPAPLGGPLYSLHKIASSVGLAASVEARTGTPCVPLFWMHGEDSDFAEIRSASIADAALMPHDLSLPDDAHRDGGLLGSIPIAPLRALHVEALRHWAPLAASAEAGALLEGSIAGARDLGEAASALMLALFADQGLVVLDPRLPAFRAAARDVIDRYLGRAEALGAATEAAGDALERATGKRPLGGHALESFVFALEDGTRHKITVAEARSGAAGRALIPSVALRPAVQDAVLPTVAMACGPGEAAYLAQLGEVFDGLGVRAACPVPRFSATWLPPSAVELLEAARVEPWELVAGADAVLKLHAEAQVPAEAREALERAHAESLAGLERFSAAARGVDASLPQMVESARAKVDFQFARLHEGLAGKVRHQLERRHPEWVRLRHYLMPGDRLQERRLASLEPFAYRGRGLAAELSSLAADHAGRLVAGLNEHFVMELG